MNKLPLQCPSCSTLLQVKTMHCHDCGTMVSGDFPLPLLASLDTEDQEFIQQFVLSSGSLKEMARIMGLSYPSVRNRLDELITKIKNHQKANV